MDTNIYASSRVELEFEECPYCHQNTATKFEFITAATGAWDIVKYSCLSCSRQYIQNIGERTHRPILVRASSDDGAYEYTEESELWRTRLNYKVAENKKEGEVNNKTCGDCKYFEIDVVAGTCKKKFWICDDNAPACRMFEPRVVTNGDVIRRGGDKALLVYRSNAACYYCSFRGTESCKSDFSNCKDGQLAWLSATAESEEDNERL